MTFFFFVFLPQIIAGQQVLLRRQMCHLPATCIDTITALTYLITIHRISRIKDQEYRRDGQQMSYDQL